MKKLHTQNGRNLCKYDFDKDATGIFYRKGYGEIFISIENNSNNNRLTILSVYFIMHVVPAII